MLVLENFSKSQVIEKLDLIQCEADELEEQTKLFGKLKKKISKFRTLQNNLFSLASSRQSEKKKKKEQPLRKTFVVAIISIGDSYDAEDDAKKRKYMNKKNKAKPCNA